VNNPSWDGAWSTVRGAETHILADGSIGRPHVLMLSGVGPAAAIAPHGIRVLDAASAKTCTTI